MAALRRSSNLWSRPGSSFKTWADPQRCYARWRSTDSGASQPMLIMPSRCTLMIELSCGCRKARKLSKSWALVAKNLSSTCVLLLETRSPSANSKTTSKCQWSSSIGSSWLKKSRKIASSRKLSRKKPFNRKWTRYSVHSITLERKIRVMLTALKHKAWMYIKNYPHLRSNPKRIMS